MLGSADTECVEVAEGADGKEVLEATGWNLLWTPDSSFGQMICKINDIGTDVGGEFCVYSGEFWNFNVIDKGKWGHSPIGLNGGDTCWNRDFSFSDWTQIVHYCARDGDIIGFAFGSPGAEPYMLKVADVNVKVDDKKENSADEDGGSIEVSPGSSVEMEIELENLYS